MIWQIIHMTVRGISFAHVVPVNDIRKHTLDEGCACRPVEDTETPDRWTHNAWDQRELYYEHGSKVH